MTASLSTEILHSGVEENLPVSVYCQSVRQGLSDSHDCPSNRLPPSFVSGTGCRLMLIVDKEDLLVPDTMSFQLLLKLLTQSLGRFPLALRLAAAISADVSGILVVLTHLSFIAILTRPMPAPPSAGTGVKM